MEEETSSFLKTFGKVPKETPKPKSKPKPKKVFKELENVKAAILCPDRVEHKVTRFDRFKDAEICRNPNCNCDFKKYIYEVCVLAINKEIIYNRLSKNKNINEGFLKWIFKLEWDKIKNVDKLYKIVWDFIRKSKFLYDLDLIIIEPKPEKVNNALEAKSCKDRKANNKKYCIGCYIDGNPYTCFYAKNTEDQVYREATREWHIIRLKDKKIPYWDKVALTFDWSSPNLSSKQCRLINSFLTRYLIKTGKIKK